MGIRFTCHACTKRLNVKSFLAGKRGICPHCGAKVEIPAESQSVSAAAVGVPHSVSAARAGGTNGAGPAAVPMHSSPARHASSASNGQAAASQPAVPMAAPVAKATTPTAAPTSSPTPPAESAPQPAENVSDPISEAPNAVWYVRPPSGGQYGPASGEIMRKWLGEGRVSTDSLIWREGWADWKTAASQFSELGGAADRAPTVTPPQPAAKSSAPLSSPSIEAESAPARGYTRRRSNNSLALVLVIVLTLAALGLLGIFFAVVTAWS